jgi:hypothetical protein
MRKVRVSCSLRFGFEARSRRSDLEGLLSKRGSAQRADRVLVVACIHACIHMTRADFPAQCRSLARVCNGVPLSTSFIALTPKHSLRPACRIASVDRDVSIAKTRSRCRGCNSIPGSEMLIGFRQQADQQRRPALLTRLIRDQVLANFEPHMGQTPLFAVNGDRIV